MFAVVNKSGQVFYGCSEIPAVFDNKEHADAVAAYFDEAYGPLYVEEVACFDEAYGPLCVEAVA